MSSADHPEVSRRKVLFIDNDTEARKARIALLREHGFMVYPALDLRQAATRCRRGAYDVVVVNGMGDVEGARAVCDQILRNNPQQHLLLMTEESKVSDQDYAVSSTPAELVRRLESVFGATAGSRPAAA